MKTIKNILSILMAFLMLSTYASAYEVRGTVAQGAGTYTWTAQNFAGFYYDIDNNLASESMNITAMNNRNIPENDLVYTTNPIAVNFSYSKDKNLPIYDAVTQYQMVGWQAENWVALNGKSNKLVKLLTEMKGSDKVTLTSGTTLSLGNGYILKISSIDAKAAPRQAWISVIKDGKVVDDAIMQENTVYNLKKNVGGENDALVLSAYVSSIFSGTETEMIQLQYVWFIDESSLIEIKSGDTYGVFKVTGTTPITLTNPSSLNLDRDSKIDLMGNMKFKVADSSDLRFYPMVEINGTAGTISTTTTSIIATSTPTPTPTSIPVNATPIVTPTPQIIYVTVTPTVAPTEVATPAPIETPAKKSPGFDAIFAIAGLFAVVFLVLRQRK